MATATATPLTLLRDCRAVQIPYGDEITLGKGLPVYLTQSLGGTFTVQVPAYGGLYRVAGEDADALGLEKPAAAPEAPAGPLDEKAVWDQLRTCYDPEIPVNIVDLGLVYDMKIGPAEKGGSRVNVKMTLTAPGCGMGTAIAGDARDKIAALPGVAEAEVELVWDPPWSYEMMSAAGKKQLGL
jgi:probable FeS assembly SUF system protein SufT